MTKTTCVFSFLFKLLYFGHLHSVLKISLGKKKKKKGAECMGEKAAASNAGAAFNNYTFENDPNKLPSLGLTVLLFLRHACLKATWI